jgi:hypothetical protein
MLLELSGSGRSLQPGRRRELRVFLGSLELGSGGSAEGLVVWWGLGGWSEMDGGEYLAAR